jgi:hypothetical protein
MEWYFPNIGLPFAGDGPINLTTYSLPNGLSLDNKDPNQYNIDQSTPVLMTARSNVAPSQTISFKNSTTLLWSAAILQVPNSTAKLDGSAQWEEPNALNVQATECALHLCIKEYTSQMLNGKILENFTDIASTRDPGSWQVHFDTDGEVANVVGYVYSDGVSDAVDALYTNTTYFPRTDLSITANRTTTSLESNNVTTVSATQRGIYALSAYIDTLFTSSTLPNASLADSSQFNCTLNSTSIPCGHLNNVTSMVILKEPLTAKNFTSVDPPAISSLYTPNNGQEHITTVFATLAESLTNTIRSSAPASSISGQLGTSHTLLRVRWPWLTLPALCMVVSTGFLIRSIYESHVDSTPLWKSGGLAYLAHGLDERSRERVQHAELGSEIEGLVEGVRVRLEKSEGGVLMLRGEEGGKGGERERGGEIA